jgi:hypothetical protein
VDESNYLDPNTLKCPLLFESKIHQKDTSVWVQIRGNGVAILVNKGQKRGLADISAGSGTSNLSFPNLGSFLFLLGPPGPLA